MLRALGWGLLAAAGMVFPLAVLAAYDVTGSSSPEPFETGSWGIAATVDIDPDTLNVKSQGNFVTAYIELPEGYDAADINVPTVTLEVEGAPGSSVFAELTPTEVGDHDADGIRDRMVKFDRPGVLGLIDGQSGEVTFVVAGELLGGQTFQGTDTVRLIGEAGSSALAPPGPAPTPPPDPSTEYQVQPGDTLWDIATRFRTTVEALVRLNQLQDANLILYGSTLNVPYVGEDGGSAPAGVSP